MTELYYLVDHLKIDYKGAFELNQMIRLITSYTKEMGFDARYDKDFEINTKAGKHVDFVFYPWKKITDFARHQIKVRILTENMVKVDAVLDNKKVKLDYGRLQIFIDGTLDLDYFSKWNKHPVLMFIRTLYNKFVYRAYTERFEQRLIFDIHHIYDRLQKMLNQYRHYRVVSKTPYFEGAR